MATIEEDYVSFEAAKLLKEKGFPQSTFRCHYIIDGNSHYKSFENRCGFGDYDIIAPTLAMAMKWLRIEHNIHVEPHIVKTRYSYGYMPNYVDLKELKQHFPFDEFDFSNADKYACITYDKACEVTINYCLKNLI